MKKLALTLAIVFAGIMSANAQLWMGGGLGTQIYENHLSFKISPEIGYAFNDQWQAALGIGYEFSQVKTPAVLPGASDIVTTTNQLSLQPYVRYVGGTIGKKFSLFVDLTGDIGLLDKSGWAVSLRPGVAWQATDKFTAAFRFGFAGYDHGFFGSYNGFFMNCELVAPSIGIYYNF